MFNEHKFYADSCRGYDTKITIKTEEEMELFKSYISNYEVNNDKKNPEWKVCFFNDGGGYNREVEQLRTKLATLRRKRGMYHHWTEKDGKAAAERCQEAINKLRAGDITDWKECCKKLDELTAYCERLIANRPVKEDEA